MRYTLVMMVFVGLFLPCVVRAGTLQFGVGVTTSVLSYNEDEIDQSRLFWGGQARLRVMKYLMGEVSLQKREDNFSVRGGSIELDTVPLQLSAIVYPLAMLPVSPYVVAGTGWYFLTATVTGDLDLPFVTGTGTIHHTEQAFHIGVGVEAFIGDHVSIGGDIRKVFLDFETSIIRYEFDAYLVNAGATFYF
jgi:hypothetical protein